MVFSPGSPKVVFLNGSKKIQEFFKIELIGQKITPQIIPPLVFSFV